MYRRAFTDKSAVNKNGDELNPVATLKDEYGGVAHIGIDDHCYVLYLQRTEGGILAEERTFCVGVTHIFPEAFEVLKTLPSLNAIGS
ncbi:hypothetical protein KAR91_38070 [Candidatus Pacearchaeota archaeon]|nr:hypothetical protein [Candidatus Pacearchaeota archaeon]